MREEKSQTHIIIIFIRSLPRATSLVSARRCDDDEIGASEIIRLRASCVNTDDDDDDREDERRWTTHHGDEPKRQAGDGVDREGE